MTGYIDSLKAAHQALQAPRQIIPHHNKVSTVVEPLDLPDVRNEAVAMHKIMFGLYKAGFPSFALSHAQIEATRPLRFFVMNPNVEGWNGNLLIINPSYQPIGSLKSMKEGCLSFPKHIPLPISRHYKILVKYYDEKLKEYQEVLRGLHAQIFQHEIDHMDGKSVYDSIVKSGIVLPNNIL